MMVIDIQGYNYELIENVKDAWDEERFQARYSEILHKYDYILGDWGFDQLRLRGFFEDKSPRSTFDTKISTVYEYLYEYCNFGCAYFILQKVEQPQTSLEEDDRASSDEQSDQMTDQTQDNH